MNVKATENRTEKRCALHKKNFSSENEIRSISEFYGDAKSSYCKRCMLIHHKNYRETKLERVKKVDTKFERFTRQMIEVVKVGVKFDSKQAQQFFTTEALRLMNELKEELKQEIEEEEVTTEETTEENVE